MSKLKVNRETVVLVPLSELEVGDCFLLGEVLYVVADVTPEVYEVGLIPAFSFNTFEIRWFKKHMSAVLMDVEMTYREIVMRAEEE